MAEAVGRVPRGHNGTEPDEKNARPLRFFVPSRLRGIRPRATISGMSDQTLRAAQTANELDFISHSPAQTERVGQRLGRQRIGPQRYSEGQAQHRTEWRGDGTQGLETIRTQRVGRRRRRIAGEADRGIGQIEQHAAQAPRAMPEALVPQPGFDKPRCTLHKAIMPRRRQAARPS